MDDFLKLLATALGVAAAGVGLVVTVDQLTARSRLRKTEAWALAAAKEEQNQHRKAYLVDLHVKSVAGVVGSIEVPMRHFAEALLMPVLTSVLVVSSFARRETGEWAGTAALVVFSVAVSTAGFRRAVRLYLERRRTVNDYQAGHVPLVQPDLGLMSQTEGGTRREFLEGLLLAVSLTAVQAGVGLSLNNAERFGTLLLGMALGLVVWPLKDVFDRGKTVRSPTATAPVERDGTVG